MADPRAVVQGPTWRFTVLTDGLVRLEQAPDGVFEDRASGFAVRRDLPVPAFEVRGADDPDAPLEILTDRFHLVYDKQPFTAAGLSVAVRGGVSTYHSVWRFGEPVPAQVAGMATLRGTARTLDEADGAVPLGPAVVSRLGFAELDDSASVLVDTVHTAGTEDTPGTEDTDGEPWFAPRRPPAGPGEPRRLDLYLFTYGLDHAAALRAFYAVSGPQPLLPRWALGSWWSRYHPYDDAGYEAVIERFEAEGLPFSVAVIDMDWHVTDVEPSLGSGWTGYSWNRDLFPDPERFLAWLRDHGLRTTLNLHPADGVRRHEDAYEDVARALGRDPASGDPVLFDATDPAFWHAYLTHVLHPLEEQGVDFWWLDWQSGEHSRVPGVDPLWVLNAVHHADSARPRGTSSGEGRLPLTFSRYAGPGSHRYPVGFSGDTVISWASLDFQPYFTASAANIGYGWWSHDVGGHFRGARDDELSARWYQLGVWSPILRLHSGANPFITKEPWTFEPAAADSMVRSLRVRARLVPYLHTMNHRAASEGVPLVVPVYHRHPGAPEAYDVPNQTYVGTSLLVAPITSPADAVSRLGRVRAWLPEGRWADVHTGVAYVSPAGGRRLWLHRDLRSAPVLAPAGALVPLDGAHVPGNDPVNPPALELVVVVGADGAAQLVEDDGAATPAVVRTPLAWDDASGTLTVGPVGPVGKDGPGGPDGPGAVVPEVRTWRVTFPGVSRYAVGQPVEVLVDGHPHGAADAPPRLGLADLPGGVAQAPSVEVTGVPTTARLEVRIGHLTPGLADEERGERLAAVLDVAHEDHDLKARVARELATGAPVATRLGALDASGLDPRVVSALTELLTAEG